MSVNEKCGSLPYLLSSKISSLNALVWRHHERHINADDNKHNRGSKDVSRWPKGRRTINGADSDIPSWQTRGENRRDEKTVSESDEIPMKTTVLDLEEMIYKQRTSIGKIDVKY